MPASGRSSAGGKISLPIVRRREGAVGAWTRTLAMCACLLCALGLACGMSVAGVVSLAEAADDPVPTTPEPAPEPAPDPTPASVARSAPTRPTTSAVKKRVIHKRKAHTKRKVQPKPGTSLRTVVTPKHTRSGVLGTQTAATLSSGGSFDFGSLLIVMTLGMAIVCFGVAAIPAPYVPWRPAAHFIAYRHLDIAIAGLGFLFLTGFLALVGV